MSDADERGRQVLAVMSPGQGYGPAQLVRMLNIEPDGAGGYRWANRTPWCPVSAPAPGQRCSSVPRSSAARMARVLRHLTTAGHVRLLGGTRRPLYARPQDETSVCARRMTPSKLYAAHATFRVLMDDWARDRIPSQPLEDLLAHDLDMEVAARTVQWAGNRYDPRSYLPDQRTAYPTLSREILQWLWFLPAGLCARSWWLPPVLLAMKPYDLSGNFETPVLALLWLLDNADTRRLSVEVTPP